MTIVTKLFFSRKTVLRQSDGIDDGIGNYNFIYLPRALFLLSLAIYLEICKLKVNGVLFQTKNTYLY